MHGNPTHVIFLALAIQTNRNKDIDEGGHQADQQRSHNRLRGRVVGDGRRVRFAPVDGLCSTDIGVVGARQPKWSALVLSCVSSSASVAHTSQKAMNRYELCRPTDTIASEFQRIVSPMLRRRVGNIHESRTLAALLPKVISGETRVPGAEKRVGASP